MNLTEGFESLCRQSTPIPTIRMGKGHSFALGLLLSLVLHGVVLGWRSPHESNEFGAQPKNRPVLLATIKTPATEPTPVPELVQTDALAQQAATIVIALDRPEASAPLALAPEAKTNEDSPKALPLEPQEREVSQTEADEADSPVQSTPAPIPDRDASIPDETLESLKTMVQGQGRIRLRFTVDAGGNVEGVTVLTSEIPPDTELAVTKRLLSTPFLPAQRGGAAAGSVFVLDLEP